uniref:G-protein coupled receptors family 1 profile domain-containing protein n=1 Tax=Acrobeloides nanus TaxID=290746 RepID=A0A914DWC8_9BILA
MFDSMCERPEFMELMNETIWILPNFTGGPTELMDLQIFCTVITEINDILTKILLHIMHIPVIILIVITLFGKEKEDAKWFVFHTALLNFILGIIWEISLINTDFEKNPTIIMVMICSIDIAVNSLFPLAFTRFFYLYFPHLYDKIFTKKTLLPWTLAYDATIVGLYSLGVFTSEYICCVVNFGVIFGTILCVSLVILKIRNMMKMVEGSKLNTLSDLRKAALLCIFQASVLSLHASTLLYTQFYTGFVHPVLEELQHGSPLDQNPLPPTLSNIPPSRTMLFTFLILDNWRYTLYQLYVIIDTFMTLFVLRSYRHTLKHVCLNAWDKVQVFLFGKKYGGNVSDMYKKRPSVNQWTG